MICTVYSNQLPLESIQKAIQETFPKAKMAVSTQEGNKVISVEIKKGLFSGSDKFKVNLRTRNEPEVNVAQASNCPLSRNLMGLHGFVQGIPAQNEKSKQLFLHKIKGLNSEFAFIPEKIDDSALVPLVKKLAHQLDAILFVNPDSILSKSTFGQHFLNRDLKLVLDQIGESEVDDYGPEAEAQYAEEENRYQSFLAQIPAEQKDRKISNEKLISDRGIKVNRYLPILSAEEGIQLRSAEEISSRVAVMAIINGFASNFITAEQATKGLKNHNLWDATSPKEKDLIANPTDEKKSSETWKCEGIWTLLWALNINPDLGDQATLCDLGNIEKDRYPLKNPGEFVKTNTQVRSKKEILDTADLYYRFHWACVDARIKSRQVEGLNEGIVYERRYALDWLINDSGEDWDNIALNT